jgi:hypothetical protein
LKIWAFNSHWPNELETSREVNLDIVVVVGQWPQETTNKTNTKVFKHPFGWHWPYQTFLVGFQTCECFLSKIILNGMHCCFSFFSDFDYPLKRTRFFKTFFLVISLFFLEVDCQIKPLISNLKAFVEKS